MWQIRASSNAGVTSSLKYISFFFLKKNIIFICNYFKMHASTTDFEMRELVLAVKIVISQVILFCKFFVTKFWNKSVFVRWQMSLIIIFWFENIISKTVSIKQKRTFSRIWMRRWMHWLQHCNYRMCKFFLSFFFFDNHSIIDLTICKVRIQWSCRIVAKRPKRPQSSHSLVHIYSIDFNFDSLNSKWNRIRSWIRSVSAVSQRDIASRIAIGRARFTRTSSGS